MRSMTGYSRVAVENESFKLKIEIKSVNNKNLNLNIRNPYSLNFLDSKIRNIVSAHIFRGSVEMRIEFEDKRDAGIEPSYNKNAAQNYMAVLEQLENDFNEKISNKLSYLIKNPDIIKKSESEIDENEYSEFIMPVLEKALIEISAVRDREGGKLKEYIIEKTALLKEKVMKIKELKELVVESYIAKLQQRITASNQEINLSKEDILKEVLLFADRADISEEISRLESHIEHFYKEIEKKGESMGKKLDFMIQEMFREINTTGVKANYYDISKLVVESKNELEKIREQIQNIE